MSSQSESSSSENQAPLKPKRDRGPSTLDRIAKMRALGKKIEVELNPDGVPLGENGKDLKSYLGIVARDVVPITYKHWNEVPTSLKDRIWETIQVRL